MLCVCVCVCGCVGVCVCVQLGIGVQMYPAECVKQYIIQGEITLSIGLQSWENKSIVLRNKINKKTETQADGWTNTVSSHKTDCVLGSEYGITCMLFSGLTDTTLNQRITL